MISPYLRRPLRTLAEILASESKPDATISAKPRRSELGLYRDPLPERDGGNVVRTKPRIASTR